MPKTKKCETDTKLANETLTYIVNRVYPHIKIDDFDLYEYFDGCLFSYLRWHNTNIRNYINDNFYTGIVQLIKTIDDNIFNDEELVIAEHLLAALTYIGFDQESKVKQDKYEAVYHLFVQKPTLKNALKNHTTYIPELLSQLFFYAFTYLEKQIMEEITKDFTSQYAKDSDAYECFIGNLPFKFTNCFMNLPFWNEDNCKKYFSLCQYINITYPEMDFWQHQCYRFIQKATEGAEGLKLLGPLQQMLNENISWTNTEKIPNYLEFDYIYPNGKNGDIVKYIFEEYGETEIKSGLTWRGKISKKYIDYFEMFYAANTLTISRDPNYQRLFTQHHIPTIITNKLTDLVYEKADWFNSFREYQDLTFIYSKKQTKKRSEVYSQLILQGQTSPKWKSEAQLFVIVSSFYPDAIYQYRPDWLHMQSLDIFIPSLSLGIEYQGVQHYEPIEHFGGVEHFIQQQENDQKKKQLCQENGVNLIEWPYSKEVTETEVRKALNISDDVMPQKSDNVSYIKAQNKKGIKVTKCTSNDEKLEVINKHLKQRIPMKELSDEYGISESDIEQWINDYLFYGEAKFTSPKAKRKSSKTPKKSTAKISKEIKLEIINKYLSGTATQKELAEEYNVSASSVGIWISSYQKYGDKVF